MEVQALANVEKSQFSIFFMNWRKLSCPTTATLENPNFHFFVN